MKKDNSKANVRFLEKAQEVFDKLRLSNVVLWTSLIRGYVEKKEKRKKKKEKRKRKKKKEKRKKKKEKRKKNKNEKEERGKKNGRFSWL